MLINFRVKNFKSFKELQNFSMVAGATKLKSERIALIKNMPILKFSAIYGANGSGKSNFVDALSFMQKRLIFGLPKYLSNVNYKLEEKCKNIPSYFEVILLINEKIFSYGFEFLSSTNKFCSEWLYELNGKDEKMIFERNIIDGKFDKKFDFSKELQTKLDVYIDEIKDDSENLFLKLIYARKILRENEELHFLVDVFEWFAKKLNVTNPKSILTSGEYFIIDERIKDMSKLLKAFDTGILKMDKINVPREIANEMIPAFLLDKVKEDFSNKSHQIKNFASLIRINDSMWIIKPIDEEEMQFEKICFYHDLEDKIPFAMGEESDGTNRLIELAEILLTKEENKVFVIDELDRCLHPQMTFHFVSEFLKQAVNNNIQLIVTTHESRLLDFEILRRDEIWFVDKKANESKIYSLEEFNVRFDKKIDKAYLEGRYGGVPIFDTIFPVD